MKLKVEGTSKSRRLDAVMKNQHKPRDVMCGCSYWVHLELAYRVAIGLESRLLSVVWIVFIGSD